MASKPDPKEKFKELAEKRVVRVIKDIRLIGNLANRSNYSYTNDQVAKIIKALEDEVTHLKKKFNSSSKGDDIEFRL